MLYRENSNVGQNRLELKGSLKGQFPQQIALIFQNKFLALAGTPKRVMRSTQFGE
jgi:hypothetical protein